MDERVFPAMAHVTAVLWEVETTTAAKQIQPTGAIFTLGISFPFMEGKKQIQGPLHLVRNGCLFRQPNEVITEKRCPHTPFNTHLPETIME